MPVCISCSGDFEYLSGQRCGGCIKDGKGEHWDVRAVKVFGPSSSHLRSFQAEHQCNTCGIVYPLKKHELCNTCDSEFVVNATPATNFDLSASGRREREQEGGQRQLDHAGSSRTGSAYLSIDRIAGLGKCILLTRPLRPVSIHRPRKSVAL